MCTMTSFGQDRSLTVEEALAEAEAWAERAALLQSLAFTLSAQFISSDGFEPQYLIRLSSNCAEAVGSEKLDDSPLHLVPPSEKLLRPSTPADHVGGVRCDDGRMVVRVDRDRDRGL